MQRLAVFISWFCMCISLVHAFWKRLARTSNSTCTDATLVAYIGKVIPILDLLKNKSFWRLGSKTNPCITQNKWQITHSFTWRKTLFLGEGGSDSRRATLLRLTTTITFSNAVFANMNTLTHSTETGCFHKTFIIHCAAILLVNKTDLHVYKNYARDISTYFDCILYKH
jgi:hypothetical protein